MPEQQLNVWIPEAYKNALTKKAEREGRSLKAIVVELIEQDIARQQGEAMERESLPIIRAIIHEEVRKAMAELYTKLHDAMLRDIRDALKEYVHQGDTRLAKLMTRTVRDSGIIRRLLYALVSKTTGREFAAKAYDHAEQQTFKELSERIASLPPSPTLEQEVE
jgi:glutamyl-tRNA reductase